MSDCKHMNLENGTNCEDCGAYIDDVVSDLQAENQRLLKDQKRLEWMIKKMSFLSIDVGYTKADKWELVEWIPFTDTVVSHRDGYDSWRDAIDAAMAEDSNDD